MPFDRRQALIALGFGTSACLSHTARDLRVAASRVDVSSDDPLLDLAQRVRAVPQEGIYELAAEELRGGADATRLLGASFLAGVQDIRPHGVGGKFHAVLMVESAFQMAELCSGTDRMLIGQWALWDFKRCQERDRREEGDWVLPPRPTVSFATEAEARREFLDAMQAWDPERADSAIVGLAPHHDHDSLFELLWPLGARCYADLGHKIIFCVQAERTLRRLGWSYAEPVLRSLVLGLLYEGPDGRRVEDFERSNERLSSFPAGWTAGKEDPARSEEFLRLARELDSAGCQNLILEWLGEGMGPRTVWDGLRLYAAEIFHRRPLSAARRHGPVHPVTELNAFAHVWLTTASENTRKLALLQLAAWLPRLRDDLARVFGELRDDRLEELGVGDEAPSIEEVFESPSTGHARQSIDAGADGPRRFLTQARECLLNRGFQDHQYKFVAALHEEARSIHPRWTSRFLAPAITYIPTALDPETEMFERSRSALRQAGLA